MKSRIYGLLSVGVVFLLFSCATAPTNNGKWSSKEVEDVVVQLVDDCLTSKGVTDSVTSRTKGTVKPTAIVGQFANETSEYINTGIISRKMESSLVNDGRFTFVANGNIRENIRTERQDQQYNASEDTAKELANETAADYMLSGTFESIVEQDGGKTTRTYYVTVELTDIERNTKVWQQQVDISKSSKKSSVRL
jgi:hypothetical protein